MVKLRVTKSGEDLLKQYGLGIKTKNADTKILVSGAVIRIEVTPPINAYQDPDYKVGVWTPNETYSEDKDKKKGGRGFCMDTKVGEYRTVKEFLAAIIECATGKLPKTGNEEIDVEVEGIPMSMKESEKDEREVIGKSIDPLLEPLQNTTKVSADIKVTVSSNFMGGKTEVSVADLKKQAEKDAEKDAIKDAQTHHPNCQCYVCREQKQTEALMTSRRIAGMGMSTDRNFFRHGVA